MLPGTRQAWVGDKPRQYKDSHRLHGLASNVTKKWGAYGECNARSARGKLEGLTKEKEPIRLSVTGPA